MLQYKARNWSHYNESLKIGLGRDSEAIKLWKKLAGYRKRSLVETSLYRFKGIFGSKLFCKSIDNQEVELILKAQVMNKMTKQGMHKGVTI